MDGTITERMPEAHCYRCGAVEIAGVCAQCQQLMCQEHLPPESSRWLRWIAQLLRRLHVVGQPYDGSVRLCHDCQSRPMLPYLMFILLLALAYIAYGIYAWTQGAIWGLAVSFIGVVWLGVLWGLPRYLANESRGRWRRTIQMAPRVNKCRIEEHVLGAIELDQEGAYHVADPVANGRVLLDLSLSAADQERVIAFRSKHRKRDRAELDYHAGFVVFKGQISNRPALPHALDCHDLFQSSPAANDRTRSMVDSQTLPGPVVALRDRIAHAPFLADSGGHEVRHWQPIYSYSLLRKIEAKDFPVQILPAIRPDTGKHVLDLTVQWRNPFPQDSSLAAYQIDLKLEAPLSWGAVEYATEGLKPSSEEGKGPSASPNRVLRWERTALSSDHQDEQKRTFTVKFNALIRQEDPVQGVVSVTFYNSLSGIAGMEYFTPAGKPSPVGEAVDIKTVVCAKFQLSLATLRHQRVLMYPNPQPDEMMQEDVEPTDAEKRQMPHDQKVSCEELLKQTNVSPRRADIRPNMATVVFLTNALSEEGFFVNWVIENPPHTGAKAEVINRYWDIGGRYFKGINPIDFHLLLTGEEPAQPGAPGPCHLEVSWSVKGAYVTYRMKCEVVGVWKQLDVLIDKVLRALQAQGTDATDYPILGEEQPYLYAMFSASSQT